MLMYLITGPVPDHAGETDTMWVFHHILFRTSPKYSES